MSETARDKVHKAAFKVQKTAMSAGKTSTGSARNSLWRWLIAALFLVGSAETTAGLVPKVESAQPENVETAETRASPVEVDPKVESAEPESIARIQQTERPKASSLRRARAPRVFRDCVDCPEMVVIPAGSFEMGSPAEEEGRGANEGPVHRVQIDKAFALGKTEVTVGEFRAFARATGYRTDAENNALGRSGCRTWSGSQWEWREEQRWDNPGFSQNERHPVVCVSWHDARAYATWLSHKTGKGYRLPSEGEWEYAARAGTRTARYWGEDPNEVFRHANLADATPRPHCSDGRSYSAPVGSFEPNRFGLHDMIGNVWEWVEDCRHDSYEGAPTDAQAWIAGACDMRMLRGGSFIDLPPPRQARASQRNVYEPAGRDNDTGFRLAITLP